jgi:hypothetical protein
LVFLCLMFGWMVYSFFMFLCLVDNDVTSQKKYFRINYFD